MRLLLKLSLLFFILIALTNCSTTRSKTPLTAEEILSEAELKLEKRKFESAFLLLERFIYNYPAHPQRQYATFLLIKGYFDSKDYTMAVVEGRDFVRDYPASEWADDAQYYVATALYKQAPEYQLDQTTTREAVVEYNTLILLYPESEFIRQAEQYQQKAIDKLARKEFENGTFYKKMGMKQASSVYFQTVVDSYPDSDWADDSLNALGHIYVEMNELGKASDSFNQLIKDYPDSEFANAARLRLDEINKWEGNK